MVKEKIHNPLISFFAELRQEIDALKASNLALEKRITELQKHCKPVFFNRKEAAEYIGCKDRYFQKEYVPNIPNYGTQRKQLFCQQEIDAYILSKGK